MKEEVGGDWGWAGPKIAGVRCLAVSNSCLPTSHLCPHQCGRRCFRAFCGIGLLVPSDRNEDLGIIFRVDLTKYIILSFRSLIPKHIHYYLNNLLQSLSSGYQGYRKYFLQRKFPYVMEIFLHYYQSCILGLVIFMFAKILWPDSILSMFQMCSDTSVISFLCFCQYFFLTSPSEVLLLESKKLAYVIYLFLYFFK